MGIDEEGTLERLKTHRRELLDPKIGEYRGRVVKTAGDGMLVEFQSVVDAVRCAVEFQRGMADRERGVCNRPCYPVSDWGQSRGHHNRRRGHLR